MVPVHQSKLYANDGIHNGNCLAACLASLLELPLWMVPPFEEMFARSDWRTRVDQWLARMLSVRLVHTQGHVLTEVPPYYIACGRAARGVHHSVIFHCGLLAHDPHPSNHGLIAVEWTYHLAPCASKQTDENA